MAKSKDRYVIKGDGVWDNEKQSYLPKTKGKPDMILRILIIELNKNIK